MKREAKEKSGKAVTVELECGTCHTHASLDLSPDKFKELSSSWKIEQECDACGRATEWSFAQADAGADEEQDFWDWLATTGELFTAGGAKAQDERRKEPRVDLRVPLRITSQAGDEEAVTSENISHSGLCFASRKTYRMGETIRVVVEPQGGVGPVTRSAVIVRANPPVDGTALYGARLEG